ncbi:MAG TPA: D-alanyl-D-alanine carboxypeptidase family protein [Pyrinomonadaceae bacterium]|nr:D-alanyl-D-alanine carboxypeptidase family protein [Pyrinomonadaceae bacterium]
MKQKKAHVAVLSCVVFALAALAVMAARTGYGQSQTKDEGAAPAVVVGGIHLQPTAVVSERRAAGTPGASAPSKDSRASAFGASAARNTALRYELSWAFGGKQQRGWYLYVPLISRTIETEKDAVTGDFAGALSHWQKTAGLEASGVLDDTTLYKFVSEWQSARLKEKTPARADQLLLAPTSDFYDPSRPEELRQVERETYAAYKRMVAAALEDPALGLKGTADGGLAPEEKFLKIVSSFRSREYQENLRRQSPNSGRAGLAVNSPHFTGRALDIYVGGEPVETKDANRSLQVQTKAYRWLVKNADRFGFKPYYYEPWHWEYVGTAGVSAK